MENLEWLEKVDKFDFNNDMYNKLGAEEFLQYRKIKALEIIAEELINNNSTLRTLVTTLENIETAIIQRG